jgi:hypothetical protein
VLASFPERARQRRWTVLLRFFLALPLAVVLLFIGIAVLAVVVVGWFGALFLGRTPRFTRDLVTSFMRMVLRLQAYAELMTDQFPSFALEEVPSDLTHLAVPDATPMNRWAVLFRIILFIPAYVVAGAIGAGIGLITIVMWFVVLVSGWLPAPVHDAYRAALRFQARYTAYALLLVPTYPWGLFGDQPTAAGSVAQQDERAEPAEHEEFAFPAPPARPWDIVIGRGATWVLIVALIIGIPSDIGAQVYRFRSTTTFQHNQLVTANNSLVSHINQFTLNGRACQTGPNEVSCLETADYTIAAELTAFAGTLSDNSNAGISRQVISNAIHDAQSLAELFYVAANAGPTKADYQRTANGVKLDEGAVQMEDALSALQHALNTR